MKTTRALTTMLAAICGVMTIEPTLADSYEFAVGEAIPLYVNDAQASYVSVNDGFTVSSSDKLDGQQKNTATATLSLTNPTAGDYLLSISGAHNNANMNLSVAVSGVGGYSTTASTIMPSPGSWSTFRDNLFLFDNLPAGELTLVLTVTGNGGGWKGHYKDFTFKALDGNAFNLLTQDSEPFTTAEGTAYVSTSGNSEIKRGSNSIGSTKSGAKMSFVLYCLEDTKLVFSYSASMKDASATVSWKLNGENCNQSASDTLEYSADWDTYNEYEHDFGILKAGVYILTGTTSRSGGGWSGNYKDFTFDIVSVVDITGDYTLADGVETIVNSVADGVMIDLHGNDLEISSACTFEGKAIFTNSVDATLANLTISGGNNKNLTFGGNLRYVVTGAGGPSAYFRDSNDVIDGEVAPNTHTGGTVFRDLTSDVRVYSFATNCGPGTLVFAGNASVTIPSQYTLPGFESVENAIFVSNANNRLAFDRSGGTFTLSGALNGDSDAALTISIGHNPNVALTGELSAYEGTLGIKHSTDNGYYAMITKPDESTGMPNGTIMMCSTAANNKLQFTKAETYELGALVTEGVVATNAYVYGKSLLKVGAKAGGTFAGNFRDLDSTALSIEKVGADTTWTLTGTNHNFSGTFTVTGGTVVFANEIATAYGSGVTVKSGAYIAGTGVVSSPVTLEDGAKVKLTGTLDAEQTYSLITVASGVAVSGKAEVETDGTYTSGTWRTKWVTNQDGSKTLTGYFAKKGLIITFH
jgi:autotransporter-associated beta strand protein